MSVEHTRSLQEAFENQLAQVLLREGIVTRAELEEALSLQVVMGGHLATNLWDLGVADCAAVDSASAELLRLPRADVSSVPPTVARRIPIPLARKLRMLPVAQEGRTLRVASCEPWNVAAIEQVAHRTGMRVETVFAGEVTLARALHDLLSVAPPARIRLGPQVRPGMADTDTESDDLLPADLMSEESFDSLYGETVLELTEVVEDEDDLPEIELLAEDEIFEELIPIEDVAEAHRLLDGADSRHEVGEILARFALSRGQRVLLLVRQRAVWIGWTGAGPGVSPQIARGLVVPSEPGSIFGLVGQTGAPYLGPLQPHRVHVRFTRALGGAQPRSVGLFPVHYRGKLVFGVYLDAGDGAHAPQNIADILVVAQRVPMALERLVQQRLTSGTGS